MACLILGCAFSIGAAQAAVATSFPGANKVYTNYPIPEPNTDWIAADFTSGASLQKPLPVHGYEVLETTPHFHWPWHGDNLTYSLEISVRDSGAILLTQSVGPNKNWYRLTAAQALLPGKWYRWRITDGSGVWSGYRDFAVAASAIAYTVPSVAEMNALILSKARPRIVPVGAEWGTIVANLDLVSGPHRDWSQSMQSQLGSYVLGRPHPWEGDGNRGALAAEFGNVYNLIFMWKLTAALPNAPNPNIYHDEALSRLRDLIQPYQGSMPSNCDYKQTTAYATGGKGWVVGRLNGCDGKSTYTYNALDASPFVLILAVGWDVFYDELTLDEKTNLSNMVGYRLHEWLTLPASQMGREYTKKLEDEGGAAYPFPASLAAAILTDASQQNTVVNQQLATTLATILADENALPLQLSVGSPFILQDGGPGRGLGYASTSETGWLYGDLARQVIGVDPYGHPKYRLFQRAWQEMAPWGAIPISSGYGELQ